MVSIAVPALFLCFGLAAALPDGVYKIMNVRSGYYLNEDVSRGVSVGSAVIVWSDGLASESHWRVTTISGNTVAIQNMNSGYYLNEDVSRGVSVGSAVIVGPTAWHGFWTLQLLSDNSNAVKNTYYLNEDVGGGMPVGGRVIVWSDGLAPESHWVFKPIDACAVNQVTGMWAPQFSVTAPTTITFKHGTTKTEAESKTAAWSTDVTASVEAGLEIEGFGAKTSVAVEVGASLSKTFSAEWSMSTEVDFEVNFNEKDVGKFVWQFRFSIDDACQSGAEPITKAYALTSGAWEEPCCIPGFCVDAPFCNVCHAQQYLIPGPAARRCRIASGFVTV